ncbi:hypothetical protein BJI69_20330 [Luteibacter rhizovicinus DSM 16549]|uniref:Uncharacterized protein n=1 Tax=Luteibacter rhizovicinus DSM 16549 TaxID=1440763 RepID=A0A0G9GZD1_9GAMM|nr:hypothetical protein [Luteibacter rhizovicinus]APG06015.1 hypothetical protein BJI69_20330 [Luteibacter rhizovicinus DSM 16549]KLD62940.1 hypothetical protein Y883_20080 [Luteibacter rhizovicinus DSM 16549]
MTSNIEDVEEEHAFYFKEKMYFSYLDEHHFYAWLESIDDVVKAEGTPRGIRVTLRGAYLSRGGAHDLLALFTRYGYPLAMLRKFLAPADDAWFRDPAAYWISELYKDLPDYVPPTAGESSL